MSIREVFGVASRYSSTSFMAGMECEIEDIEDYQLGDSGRWSATEDGSLRNSGREFISLPLGKAELIDAFKHLHTRLLYKTDNKQVRFSPRTSIHVHVNCLELSTEQVKQIVMWYVLFEPIFFRIAAPNRRNNIHCVGLDQTILNEFYKRNLEYLHGKWSKYTALNLLPLSSFGTLEFRHLEGTDDVAKVAEWLTILENLWTFGKDTKLSREHVFSDETVRQNFLKIFAGTSFIKYADLLPTMLSDSLMDVKLSLL